MTRAPLFRVLALAGGLRARLALSVLLGACAVGAGVGLMATSGYLISRAAQRPPILALAVAIVGVRFFGISRGVFRYAERLVSHDAALRLLGRLRGTFFARLEPLVPDGLPALRTGDLLSRFVADVDALQYLFVRALGPPLVALTVGGGAVFAAALVEPAAGAVLAAAILTAGVAVPLLLSRLVRDSNRREAPSRAVLTSEVIELLDAAPELAVYGSHEESLARVAAADADLARVRRRSALTEALGEGLVTLITSLALVGVLAVSAPAVHVGRVDGVLVGMLALLALSTFEAVRPLPAAAQHLGATATAAERLYEVIDREPPIRDPVVAPPPPDGTRLEVAGLRVRYGDNGRWILDGVDLQLRRGTAVALVGPSGAGKTTLAHCLVRFRDPDEGRILLDGRDLRDYTQDQVRGAVQLVGQDAHLFATTIRENLRIAAPDAHSDELERALEQARVWSWVAGLPAGIDTHVGDLGERLSGGQRQRIALARAFLSAAPFLIFDEPTAHLDAATAVDVTETLLDASRDRGVLLITHSKIGLDLVDEVVVLDNGRITEPGAPTGPSLPSLTASRDLG